MKFFRHVLLGQEVVLEVRMRDADLYAIRFE